MFGAVRGPFEGVSSNTEVLTDNHLRSRTPNLPLPSKDELHSNNNNHIKEEYSQRENENRTSSDFEESYQHLSKLIDSLIDSNLQKVSSGGILNSKVTVIALLAPLSAQFNVVKLSNTNNSTTPTSLIFQSFLENKNITKLGEINTLKKNNSASINISNIAQRKKPKQSTTTKKPHNNTIEVYWDSQREIIYLFYSCPLFFNHFPTLFLSDFAKFFKSNDNTTNENIHVNEPVGTTTTTTTSSSNSHQQKDSSSFLNAEEKSNRANSSYIENLNDKFHQINNYRNCKNNKKSSKQQKKIYNEKEIEEWLEHFEISAVFSTLFLFLISHYIFVCFFQSDNFIFF
jgi:hypothetical protein